MPIDRVMATFPKKASDLGQEGWVRVSFVIDIHGKVVDPIIHDSTGNKLFEKAAINAVSKWQYSPALRNGKPIEQCQSKVHIDFLISGQERTVSRKFHQIYRTIFKQLTDNQLNKASERLQDLSQEQLKTYTEYVHLQSLWAILYEKQGQDELALEKLRQIENQGYKYLDEASYASMMSKLFVRYINNNSIGKALELITKIQTQLKEHELSKALVDYRPKLEALIEGNEEIVVKGRGREGRIWYHQLVRSHFEIHSLESPLEKVELRCANKRSTHLGISSSGFKIPKKWGHCGLYIVAEPGQIFDIVEIPDEKTGT